MLTSLAVNLTAAGSTKLIGGKCQYCAETAFIALIHGFDVDPTQIEFNGACQSI